MISVPTQETYVNNARILEAVLQDGDVIRLGNLEMIFVEQTETTTPFPMKSRNDVWHEELQNLGNVAKTDFPVLILGPSGTGKDVIAQALHQTSDRQGPFSQCELQCPE